MVPMDDHAVYQQMKDLREHLTSRGDDTGLRILRKAMDLIEVQTLADVSEDKLIDFLNTTQETEDGTTDPWVSSSAVRTNVGFVTRRLIEKEINRRVGGD